MQLRQNGARIRSRLQVHREDDGACWRYSLCHFRFGGCYSSHLVLLASVFSSVKRGPHCLSFRVNSKIQMRHTSGSQIWKFKGITRFYLLLVLESEQEGRAQGLAFLASSQVMPVLCTSQNGLKVTPQEGSWISAIITTAATATGVRAGWGRATSINGATEDMSQASNNGATFQLSPQAEDSSFRGGDNAFLATQ